jgi:hypothetical protein
LSARPQQLSNTEKSDQTPVLINKKTVEISVCSLYYTSFVYSLFDQDSQLDSRSLIKKPDAVKFDLLLSLYSNNLTSLITILSLVKFDHQISLQHSQAIPINQQVWLLTATSSL